ncbi:MAG: hypothetical protein ACOYMA_09485 [Bacteroidia bacterium]
MSDKKNVEYECPKCGFEAESTHCDDCNGLVKWNNDTDRTAHCGSCKRAVFGIKCRGCGYRFSLD